MAIIISDIDDTVLRAGIYPIRKTIDFLNEQAKNHTIVMITGRSQSQADETRAALKKAGLNYNRLYLNNTDLPDNEFKKQKAEEVKKMGRVILAVENNPNARRAYSSIGIKAVHPSRIGPRLLKEDIWAGRFM